MPRATVSQETTRFELKTCPEGFVSLRTLSFHEMNQRQDIVSRMYQEQRVNKRGQKATQEEIVRGYYEIMNVAVTEYEFRNCIVDHNLEDENGNLIDFTRPMQAWRLDPKIGDEIGRYIDSLNQAPEEDEMLPLPTSPSSSSLIEESTPSPSLVTE